MDCAALSNVRCRTAARRDGAIRVPGVIVRPTPWTKRGRRWCRASSESARTNNHVHLGTLGTGNHFIEVCLDESGTVWFMLHSGSRGVGNAIGTQFIELAQQDMRHHIANLPDRDLAYFEEGSTHFDDYVEAVGWAQEYARRNREVMMAAQSSLVEVVHTLRQVVCVKG